VRCCCRRVKRKSKYYLGDEVSDNTKLVRKNAKSKSVELVSYKELLKNGERSNDYSAAKL
jgi:hypothetical protein